ncbi:uncharacterized protein LOC143294383 isoform X2 [Babylonia areolata]|uniref:uncharacterized protein LOC143294383 isoform X2 n=1 Tax=Babylonia areolata TaxID=304850 RepID=UPI003FD5F924
MPLVIPNDRQSWDRGDLDEMRRNRTTVVSKMLSFAERHTYHVKNCWEKLDTVLKGADDSWTFYRKMNPWEGADDGAAGGAGQSSHQRLMRGPGCPTPYPPHTPLDATVGLADHLEDLCRQTHGHGGPLWRKLAKNLGLPLEDELQLKSCQAEDLHNQLLDAYVERFKQKATVGQLTLALTQLGREGARVVLRLETEGIIPPSEAYGSEAGGVCSPRHPDGGHMVTVGASAENDFSQSHGFPQFGDASAGGWCWGMPDSSCGNPQLGVPPRSLPTEGRMAEKSCTAGLPRGLGSQGGDTADVLPSSLNQTSGSTTGIAERLDHDQFLSVEDNSKQATGLGEATERDQRGRKPLNIPCPHPHPSSLDQSPASVNQAPSLSVNDLQMDAETGADSTAATGGFIAQGVEAADDTVRKEICMDQGSRQCFIPRGDHGDRQQPPTRHSDEGFGVQLHRPQSIYIDSPKNVFITETMTTGINGSAHEPPQGPQRTYRGDHQGVRRAENHQQCPGRAARETVASGFTAHPEPWNTEAHETELKLLTDGQDNNDDDDDDSDMTTDCEDTNNARNITTDSQDNENDARNIATDGQDNENDARNIATDGQDNENDARNIATDGQDNENDARNIATHGHDNNNDRNITDDQDNRNDDRDITTDGEDNDNNISNVTDCEDNNNNNNDSNTTTDGQDNRNDNLNNNNNNNNSNSSSDSSNNTTDDSSPVPTSLVAEGPGSVSGIDIDRHNPSTVPTTLSASTESSPRLCRPPDDTGQGGEQVTINTTTAAQQPGAARASLAAKFINLLSFLE